MSEQLLGLNRWSSFTVCSSANIWKGHSAHELNTSDLGRGEGLRSSCRLSGRAESQNDRWNSCSCPHRGEQICGSCHSASLPLFFFCFFCWRSIFFLISNKAEMNVCGNWLGEGELKCCALSLTISPVCVLLLKGYTSHQLPIMRNTWDESPPPPISTAWKVCFLSVCVTSLFISLQPCIVAKWSFICLCCLSYCTCLPFSLPVFLSFPVSLTPPFSPPQSICIMSICQTASVCSN